MAFLGWTYYGNTVRTWLLALLVMAVAIVVLEVLRFLVVRRLTAPAANTEIGLASQVAAMIRKANFPIVLVVAVYFASQVLVLPEKVSYSIDKAAVIALLILGAFWGNGLVSYLVSRYLKQVSGTEEVRVAAVTAFGFLGKLALWAIVALMILGNLGIDVTALVAGLGIGGIAVALAVQNILGDLFGSFSIVLDKPFVIGDFITVDNFMGTVEHIGLKSTRVRSLSGEQLVFSNSDLLKSRIRNFKRMTERRVVFSIGVTYQTSYEKLAAIPDIVCEIIESQEQVRFERAHFKEYGPFSLNFEVVYWVQDADYSLFMDVQQAINLAIFRRFGEEGIEFAYPTQTLFVNKEAALVADDQKAKLGSES